MSASEPQVAARDEAARIVAVLSFCGFASTFAMRFVDPMVGVIARDTGRDPHDVALLASAFALPYALVQPVLGPVGDALGKVRVIKVCLVCLAVALLLGALSRDLEVLLALRVLSGMAAGGVIPLVLATIGDRVPIAERQVAISRFLLFWISGQLIGGSLSGVLTAAIGWRGVFLLAALLGAVAAAAAVAGLSTRGVAAGRFSPSVAFRRYAGIVAMPRARALFAFVFVEGALVFGIQPYLAPLLEDRGAGGSAEAGLIIASFAAGGILYTLAVRGLLRLLGIRRMLIAAGLLGAGAFSIVSGEPAWPVQAGAFLALGAAFYMLHNSFQTQVTELTAEARGSAVSLHAFSYFVGQALGPPLIGFGILMAGAPITLVLCAAGLLTLGLVAASVIGRNQPRPL
ncbi:MAG: MFS transporter [Methylobacteriaceae bacterium]|nr:MFS transporter [Methylobacteriaceae bacterium]